MTVANIEETMLHDFASEEEMADALAQVLDSALQQGMSASDARALFEQAYDHMRGPEHEMQRRAIREALGIFHGYCAPSVAL